MVFSEICIGILFNAIILSLIHISEPTRQAEISGQGTFVPKVDVVETEKAFELFVEVPGMNKEDFNLEVNDNYLTISGERKFSSEKNEKNFHSIETRYGSFSRSFTLPDSVSSDKINAKYNNGILELTIPKDEKKLLKSTIKVN